jgi:GTPase
VFHSSKWFNLSGGHQSLSTSMSKKNNVLAVTVVGRPNTGKSTLFNRLTKTKKAIVSNVPGTTRDRTEGFGTLIGLPLRVIDTGGFDNRGSIIHQVIKQVEFALVQSDVILFLLDSRSGVTGVDRDFAKWLRESLGKLKEQRSKYSSYPTKVIVLANKTEGANLSDAVMDTISDAYRLGFGEPLLISASHGDGMGDLGLSLIEIARKYGLDDGELEVEKMQREAIQLSMQSLEQGESETSSKLQQLKQQLQPTPNSIANNGSIATDLDPTIIPSSSSSTNDENPETQSRTIQLAIMGKPNVGKSTLLNAMVGEERVITGPTPGLTRDAIHVQWMFQNRPFLLVDTAGLTRLRTDEKLLMGIKESKQLPIHAVLGKALANTSITLPGIQEMKVEEDPSQFSSQISEFALISALNALRFAQVIMIVVEASQGTFSNVDLQLARRCLLEGRGVFIAANKFDTLKTLKISAKEYSQQVKSHTDEYFREFGDVPVVVCSGLHQQNIHSILSTAIQVHDAWEKRISTWILNRWLKELLVTAPTAKHGTKVIKIKYITQAKTRPPTFTLFCNVQELPNYYERYVRSKIQEEFRLTGVPIRFIIKKTEGNRVKKHLLKQGKHTRHGIGRGEKKGKIGPNRNRSRHHQKIVVKSLSTSSASASEKGLKKKKMSISEKRRRRDSRSNRSRFH